MPKFLYPTCIERPRRNRDSEFTKWQQPAMCYVALGWHAIVFARWQHPAMWHVTRSSGIMTMNSPCGSTLAAVRQVALWWHAIEFAQTSAIFLNSTSGFDFDHISRSPQSTCHSAPVSEILSKSDHHRQKKMTSSSSCRFSRWQISAI